MELPIITLKFHLCLESQLRAHHHIHEGGAVLQVLHYIDFKILFYYSVP